MSARGAVLLAACCLMLGCGTTQPRAEVTPARPDGAVPVHAPRSPASAQNPLMLPDDGSLVFTQFHHGYNEGPAGLFRLEKGGTVRTLLDERDCDSVNMPGSAYCARTRRMAFGSDRREREEIWTMSLAPPLDLRRVTRHTDADAFREPTFSPDGRWIVFERHAMEGDDDDRLRGSLWKVRADGTGLARLTEGPAAGCDDRQPNWSPAGDAVVFQRRRAGQPWRVCALSVGDGRVRAVTHGEADATDPSWSPDGRRIVFSSEVAEGTASLFTVPAQGGTPKRLTSVVGWDDAAPCWSPDGRWIAFESRQLRGAGERPAALWRIPVR